MYGEKIQEKGHDTPTSVHQPELKLIIERLQSVVNHYDGILCQTRNKLQMIKKHEEPSNVTDRGNADKKEPESATEEINRLLFYLCELNERAEINLQHLSEIV